MPTWQHQRTEAARRAELFGGSEGSFDEDGPGTRAPALLGSSSMVARSIHSRSDGVTLGGRQSQSSSALQSEATWTRMASTQGVAAGVRPQGYFEGPVASPGGTRTSVDSNASNTCSSSTFVQKRMVHRAVEQHQGTTASAERSLAVAENCLDIGVTTLEEVARQGEGLDKTERGLDMVRQYVNPSLRWGCQKRGPSRLTHVVFFLASPAFYPPTHCPSQRTRSCSVRTIAGGRGAGGQCIDQVHVPVLSVPSSLLLLRGI
jgi:hypothetical protein